MCTNSSFRTFSEATISLLFLDSLARSQALPLAAPSLPRLLCPAPSSLGAASSLPQWLSPPSRGGACQSVSSQAVSPASQVTHAVAPSALSSSFCAATAALRAPSSRTSDNKSQCSPICSPPPSQPPSGGLSVARWYSATLTEARKETIVDV